MKTKIKISHGGVQGWLKLESVRADGTKRLLCDWFPNLITDAGLEMIGTGLSIVDCSVGEGNTAPTFLDTALESELASTNNVFDFVHDAQQSPPYYGSVTNTWQFLAGEVVGTVREVAIGNAGIPLCRALTPTDVVVPISEGLDVSYEIRLYPRESDFTGQMDIDGDNYFFTGRVANVIDSEYWGFGNNGSIGGIYESVLGVTMYDGPIGDVTTIPSGNSSSFGTVENAAYVPGSLRREVTVTAGPDDANFAGGIMSILLRFGADDGRFGAVQIEVDPPIPKVSPQTLTLEFGHIWTRKEFN